MLHNGVMVPPKYKGKGLNVTIKGASVTLNEIQEERAMAWAKKIGTPYVEDPVFAKNFHEDFSLVLGVKVLPGEVDYSEIYHLIEEEREYKKSMPKEKKKLLAAKRKEIREINKEKFGWAFIDGERCEIGNYMVEPSSIFMGRGEHPLRGKWKEGPRHEDVELNLSPSAPIPQGKWKNILWDPKSIWIARWRDKLSSKIKYVWPHESSPIQQMKDIEKYNKAIELQKNLRKVRNHIKKNLTKEDIKIRKIATVCYLIDNLNFRIGDEKDEEEEADTVGASSLRPEHICFNADSTVTFDFLGKDSVRHTISAKLDPEVENNLREFTDANEDTTLFNEVNSSTVSTFLDEVLQGLSAKVFRTCHATEKVQRKLKKITVHQDEPIYKKKYVATLANLDAAIICNHKRTIPKTWEQSLSRQKERLEKRKQKSRENTRKYRQLIKDAEAKFKERIARYQTKLKIDKKKLEEYKQDLKTREEKGKPTISSKKRVQSKRKAIRNTRERIKTTKLKHIERLAKLKERKETRRLRDKAAIEKAALQVEAKELTRDYNLGTSLKSYVDPRVYLDWGKKVDYDWRNYYSKNLEKKFSWIDPEQKVQETQ
jgi:DNA topoisomerase-1